MQEDVDRLEQELAAVRADTAKIVHALDCSTQLIEALIAWLPEGQVQSPQLGAAHGAWVNAMKAIHG